MCIIVFDLLTNFKAEDTIFFFLLHFSFLFKEILKEKRLENHLKTFFCLFLWENIQVTPILDNENCTFIQQEYI